MIFGASDLDGIVMMARPKLVNVACDEPAYQGCVLIGDGDAVWRLPDHSLVGSVYMFSQLGHRWHSTVGGHRW